MHPSQLTPDHVIGLTRNGITLHWDVLSVRDGYLIVVRNGSPMLVLWLAIQPDGTLRDPNGGLVELAWARRVDSTVWSPAMQRLVAVGVGV